MRSRLSLLALSLVLSLAAGVTRLNAAPTSDEVSFRYRIGKVEVDSRLNPNADNMTKLENILAGPKASSIQRIELRASSSPEGPYYLNERYAHERAEWIKAFINGRYPSLPSSVWQVEEVSEDWDGVADYLRRSTEDYKAEAMQIVRSNSSNRKELLQDLYAGEAWDDLYKYAFPWLRAVKLRIVYSDEAVSGQQQGQQQGQQEGQQQQGQQQQGQGQRPRVKEPIVSEGTLAIFFERSSTAVKPEFHGNAGYIELIKQEVSRGANKLELVGFASPEGTTAVNRSISKKRLDTARDYLSKQTGIPVDSITLSDAGEDWTGLTKAVESSYDGADREEALRVLHDSPLSQDAKENTLKKLDGGRTWQSWINDQMTDLRRIEVKCVTVQTEPEKPEIPDIIENEIDIPQEEIEVEGVDVEIEPTDITVETIEMPEEPVVVEPVGKYPRPVLGVYTNLLYDAATAFNLGLEIPLGRHLTINADAIYTDMPFYGNGNHMGLKIGELGAHYYFNDEGPGLKGWFVTANAGGGFYDLATRNKRAEGSLFYLSGGAGYSFQLGPESSHWRLMLSAEMGPMRTPYKYYETNEAGTLYLKRQDDFMWGLPTRFEVSLMYVFYSKNKMF